MNRHRYLIMFVVLSLLLPAAAGASEGAKLIRYPDLDPSGKMIAFSYQGDIWTASVDGQWPSRITIHEGYEASPRWSPDGKSLAFSSNRFGNYDVFTVPAGGGVPRRLTWHSTGDVVTDWAKSGILFNSRRLYARVEWDGELLVVEPEGGTPSRDIGAVGRDAVESPDGRFVAFIRGACRVEREAYKGPATRQVWIYDRKNDRYIRVTTESSQHSMPRWSGPRTLYYLGAETGRYNIYKVGVDEEGAAGQATRITSFEDDGVRYFDVSEEGGVIVIEYQTGIYSMGLDGSGMKEIVVHAGSDYRFDPVEHKTYTNQVTGYAVSPDGKYTAAAIHGEIFVTENHKKKNRTVNISKSPWRDAEPVWTSDTTLAFVSDREGQYDIYLAASADEDESDIFKSLKHKLIRVTSTEEDESALTASPDGKKVSFLRGNGMLIVADLSADGKLSGEKVLLDGWSIPSGIAWAPDGKWLAYALEDLNFDSEIYIHPVDGSSAPVNVSMHPRGDFGPVWSPDGSKLAWWSGRNNQDDDVWFVWLKRSDWEKTRQDWEEEEDGEIAYMDGKKDSKDKKKGENGEDAEGEKEPEPIQIDFEDIHERLVQVTRLTGDERDIAISKDGKTFYFTSNNPAGEGRDLFSVKWDGTEVKQITQGGANPAAISFDPQYAYLFAIKRGSLSRMKAGTEKMEGVALLAHLSVDYAAEREQIFEEAWRALDNMFYDPGFHGEDWKALRKKYKPWAMMASTKHDFRDIFNIMAGQLNASHMGMYGGDRGDMQAERTGLLGVDIEQEKKGVRILRVVPGSPADRTVSKLEAGELITSVDGAPAGGEVNFYSLLINKAGSKVLLTVEDKKGKEREVAIRPAARLRNELYDEWVKERRAMTEKESGGRLGYLHIEAMGWESFERFEREFAAAALGKDAIVIDVRYNGGGWTTDYLMAVLNVDQHAYTIPRGATKSLEKGNKKFQDYYPYAERLPFYPWMKPSVALCNENSYSNAEIFSHAYKTLGIGKLVGEPTFGAVISTGGRRLIDGSLIRLPFRAWYVKATGENMEHGPAVPDIIVEERPECKAKGTDPQLKKAIEVLLGQLD